jgi:transketolase
MPSWTLFEQQPRSYREAVLPPSVGARVAVEQACPLGWDRYVGAAGATITMSTFGASAPLEKLQERFGFTVANVVMSARSVMSAERK